MQLVGEPERVLRARHARRRARSRRAAAATDSSSADGNRPALEPGRPARSPRRSRTRPSPAAGTADTTSLRRPRKRGKTPITSTANAQQRLREPRWPAAATMPSIASSISGRGAHQPRKVARRVRRDVGEREQLFSRPVARAQRRPVPHPLQHGRETRRPRHWNAKRESRARKKPAARSRAARGWDGSTPRSRRPTCQRQACLKICSRTSIRKHSIQAAVTGTSLIGWID